MAGTFQDLIAQNRRNSALLVGTFLILIAVVAWAFFVAGSGSRPEQGLVAAAVVVGIGLLLTVFAWYGGAGAILSMSGAKEIRREDDPQLWNVIEEMAIAAGLPMPKVYLIEDSAMNAFATGRDPAHAAVAVTRGLRERLNRAELQGVVAHEMSHVRNFDIRFNLLLVVLVGLLALLAGGFRNWMWWGGGGRRRGSRDGGLGPIMIIVWVLPLIFAILAPLLGKLIQLAASRQREYLADASGVELTRYPEGLASALEKLGSDQEVLKVANRATEPLYIVNPFKPFEARAKGLFSTHPPIAERIARLRALEGKPVS